MSKGRIRRAISNYNRRRHRSGDLFARRIIVTIHPWSLFVMTVGIIAAIVISVNTISRAISFIAAIVSLGVVLISRREVANLRHDIARAAVIMDDDDVPVEHEIQDEAERGKPQRLFAVDSDKDSA